MMDDNSNETESINHIDDDDDNNETYLEKSQSKPDNDKKIKAESELCN